MADEDAEAACGAEREASSQRIWKQRGRPQTGHKLSTLTALTAAPEAFDAAAEAEEALEVTAAAAVVAGAVVAAAATSPFRPASIRDCVLASNEPVMPERVNCRGEERAWEDVRMGKRNEERRRRRDGPC